MLGFSVSALSPCLRGAGIIKIQGFSPGLVMDGGDRGTGVSGIRVNIFICGQSFAHIKSCHGPLSMMFGLDGSYILPQLSPLVVVLGGT